MMTNNIFLNGICRPWNIHAGTFLALSLRVLADAKGADSLSGWREKFSQFVPQRQSMAIDPNGIAHISIHGTLFNKEAPYFVAGYGGTDYEEVLQDIAVASKEAKGIFLTVDSGGGHACGNDTADATVGSIGTILPLMDVSGLWQALGVKPDYITNKEGTLKTAGYPPSQNDDERAALQAETQSYFELFKSHVLAHRNIEKEDMRGQAFVGAEAYMDETNKEKTLAEAISQIETLTADKTKLDSDLATASSRIAELETELNATQEKLTALEQKHRDIDSEVSAKVAEVAAQSGVAPIADVPNSGDESIEDLAKRIDEAQGVEKAKLIESNYDRIMSALKGVY